MITHRLALIDAPLADWQLRLVKLLDFDKLLIPFDASNTIARLGISAEQVKMFSSEMELFKFLEEYHQSILYIFSKNSFTQPTPTPTVRFLHKNDFHEGLNEDLNDLLRRSTSVVCDLENQLLNVTSDLIGNIDFVPCINDISKSKMVEIEEKSFLKKFPLPPTENIKFMIVTPSYNQADYIEKTIQSVLNQNYKNFDYLIVDGKSTDKTLDVLNNYKGRVSWISEKDHGYADAVNKGLLGKKADYYIWLPSDDLFYDNHVLSRLALSVQKNNADVIFGDAVYCDEFEKPLSFYKTREYDFNALKDSCFICQPATTFSAKYFNQVGGLDTKLKSIADYDLWLRLSDLKLSFLRQGYLTAKYRLQPNSITVSQKKLTYIEIFKLQLKRYGKVEKNWVIGALYLISEGFKQKRDFGLNEYSKEADTAPTPPHPIFFKKIKNIVFELAIRLSWVQRLIFMYLRSCKR